MFLSEKEGTGIKLSESEGTGIRLSESEGTGIRRSESEGTGIKHMATHKFLFSLLVLMVSQLSMANNVFLYETKNTGVYEGNIILNDGTAFQVVGVLDEFQFEGIVTKHETGINSADDGTGNPINSADDGTGNPINSADDGTGSSTDSADDGTGSSTDSADDGTGGTTTTFSVDDGTGAPLYSADDGTGSPLSADDGTGLVMTTSFECDGKNQIVAYVETQKDTEIVLFDSVSMNNELITCGK